jgi:CheY-like chemotaxis protein
MKRPVILIVHHDQIALDLYEGTYATYLSPVPQLLTATNNTDALKICAEQAVDLIITNISRARTNSLSEAGDGLTLLEKVKGQFPSVPVFVATGSVSGEQYHRALELGADQWFALPEGMSDLLTAVASRLQLQVSRL